MTEHIPNGPQQEFNDPIIAQFDKLIEEWDARYEEMLKALKTPAERQVEARDYFTERGFSEFGAVAVVAQIEEVRRAAGKQDSEQVLAATSLVCSAMVSEQMRQGTHFDDVDILAAKNELKLMLGEEGCSFIEQTLSEQGSPSLDEFFFDGAKAVFTVGDEPVPTSEQAEVHQHVALIRRLTKVDIEPGRAVILSDAIRDMGDSLATATQQSRRAVHAMEHARLAVHVVAMGQSEGYTGEQLKEIEDIMNLVIPEDSESQEQDLAQQVSKFVLGEHALGGESITGTDEEKRQMEAQPSWEKYNTIETDARGVIDGLFHQMEHAINNGKEGDAEILGNAIEQYLGGLTELGRRDLIEYVHSKLARFRDELNDTYTSRSRMLELDEGPAESHFDSTEYEQGALQADQRLDDARRRLLEVPPPERRNVQAYDYLLELYAASRAARPDLRLVARGDTVQLESSIDGIPLTLEEIQGLPIERAMPKAESDNVYPLRSSLRRTGAIISPGAVPYLEAKANYDEALQNRIAVDVDALSIDHGIVDGDETTQEYFDALMELYEGHITDEAVRYNIDQIASEGTQDVRDAMEVLGKTDHKLTKGALLAGGATLSVLSVGAFLPVAAAGAVWAGTSMYAGWREVRGRYGDATSENARSAIAAEARDSFNQARNKMREEFFPDDPEAELTAEQKSERDSQFLAAQIQAITREANQRTSERRRGVLNQWVDRQTTPIAFRWLMAQRQFGESKFGKMIAASRPERHTRVVEGIVIASVEIEAARGWHEVDDGEQDMAALALEQARKVASELNVPMPSDDEIRLLRRELQGALGDPSARNVIKKWRQRQFRMRNTHDATDTTTGMAA